MELLSSQLTYWGLCCCEHIYAIFVNWQRPKDLFPKVDSLGFYFKSYSGAVRRRVTERYSFFQCLKIMTQINFNFTFSVDVVFT